MIKSLIIALIAALAIPTIIKAEPYPRHKYTCEADECTDGEIAAIKLVNDTYWKMLTERIKENKYYKYPWYFVYKEKKDCKYTVAAKEDMPTHTVNMEWIDVDICEKTTKLKYRDGRYR